MQMIWSHASVNQHSHALLLFHTSNLVSHQAFLPIHDRGYEKDVTEICYLDKEDAKEMAAMNGILYLSGAVDQHSKYFHFAPMQSSPPHKPFWNEMVVL